MTLIKALAKTNNPEKRTRFSYPFRPFPGSVFLKIAVPSLVEIVFPLFPSFSRKEGTPLFIFHFWGFPC